MRPLRDIGMPAAQNASAGHKWYQWMICLACTLALFCTGGLSITGFTVYVPYLIEQGGLTNAQVSILLMIRNLLTLCAMFFVVRYIRKLDIRAGLSLATLGIAASFLLYGIAANFAVYCAAAAIAGLSYGLGGMVSVSVIIRRWFDENEGLALGICSAGTGLSAVFGTPVITSWVENGSMPGSFLKEAWVVAAMAATTFFILRNYPSEEKREEVLQARQQKLQHVGPQEWYRLNPIQKSIVYIGVLLTGASCNASSFLTVLLREKGFDAYSVAWFVSFMGIALCFGKCVYGMVVDHWGRYRAGNLFHAAYILGVFLSAVCISGNKTMAFFAMLSMGFGFPMLTVGLSELAEEIAYPAAYSDAVKQLQILYMVGFLAFGMVPGLIADQMGEYRISYCILASIALLAALLQQNILRSKQEQSISDPAYIGKEEQQ